MKMFNKYISGLLVGACAILTLSSCSEDVMDRINKNDNNPLDVNARFIVADVITSTAFNSVGGDFSLYSSIYMELEAGIHNQMFNAEIRRTEPTASTTYNNTWGSTYTNIKNAKLAIKKCSPGGPEEGSDITLGIAKVLLAYNGALLTDLFGDVPYFQAGELKANGLPLYPQAKVDRQEDIYKDIIKQLDEAIVLFDGEDLGPFGAIAAEDFIYSGNGSDWKKAAYGLKARYTMRLLAKSENKTQSLNNVLEYISKSFTSADKEFKFAKYNGDSQNNPLASFTYSREALAVGKSLVNKFVLRNDPRVTQLISAPRPDITKLPPLRANPSSIVAAVNGNPTEAQLFYDILVTNYSWSAPTQLLSYHELLYLKAEAEARLGNTANAETALKTALSVGFANLSNSITAVGYKALLNDSVSNAYYLASVKPLFDANPVKEIMNQKYLSFVGASGESVEAYNDYRRMLGLEENFVTLENPLNGNPLIRDGKFPLRFVYGNSDVLANPNVAGLVGDGTYVYTEPVWWAGGTR